MKKSKAFMKKFIALVLVAVSVFSLASVGIFSAGAAATKETFLLGLISDETFGKLLENAVSAGAKSGVSAALSPLISIIGQEFLGLPSETGLPEIMERLDEIEGKLDEIQTELTEGFSKVLAEIEKNEKMRSTINALAEAEFLANIILNLDNAENDPESIAKIAEMTGAEQKELIEINADTIKYETVEKLYNELLKAKAYLSNNGYIDSNYESAYKIYYDYMKKQSMFCGEAAMNSELFWEVMKESYSRSCVALIYALEQQLAMYELSEAEPGNGITKEAIEAAAVAETFGAKSVIENKLSKVKSDGKETLLSYCEFLQKTKNEATVFINKGTCYIELKPELNTIEFNGCNSYDEYVAAEGFEKGGITKEIYEDTIKNTYEYFYNKGYNYIEANSISYEEFISNSGICIRRDAYKDADGTVYVKNEVDWNKHSKYAFKYMLLNTKLEKFNAADKPEDSTLETLMNYVKENYETMSIAEYLKKVGFSFGDYDMTKEGIIYMPTSSFTFGNGSRKISCNGSIYDLGSFTKDKVTNFDSCFTNSDSTGTLFYFENAEKTIRLTINSISMDMRIYNGVYTIEGKEILGYEKDGTPVYRAYKAVYEVEGTETINLRLPVMLDYETVTITLGYEGLGASSNHENLCSFKLSELSEKPEKITLTMEGYTKIWLGYGVNAEILCDGVSVAKGKG